MRTVNIHEAKTHLSPLLDRAAKGEPFIAKVGKPMVKVVPLETPEAGLARGSAGAFDGRCSRDARRRPEPVVLQRREPMHSVGPPTPKAAPKPSRIIQGKCRLYLAGSGRPVTF